MQAEQCIDGAGRADVQAGAGRVSGTPAAAATLQHGAASRGAAACSSTPGQPNIQAVTAHFQCMAIQEQQHSAGMEQRDFMSPHDREPMHCESHICGPSGDVQQFSSFCSGPEHGSWGVGEEMRHDRMERTDGAASSEAIPAERHEVYGAHDSAAVYTPDNEDYHCGSDYHAKLRRQQDERFSSYLIPMPSAADFRRDDHALALPAEFRSAISASAPAPACCPAPTHYASLDRPASSSARSPPPPAPQQQPSLAAPAEPSPASPASATSTASVPTYEPDVVLERVSIKLYGCHPCDLPPLARDQLAEWLGRMDAVLVDYTVRSGCVHIIADVLLPTAAARRIALGCGGLLGALPDGSCGVSPVRIRVAAGSILHCPAATSPRGSGSDSDSECGWGSDLSDSETDSVSACSCPVCESPRSSCLVQRSPGMPFREQRVAGGVAGEPRPPALDNKAFSSERRVNARRHPLGSALRGVNGYAFFCLVSAYYYLYQRHVAAASADTRRPQDGARPLGAGTGAVEEAEQSWVQAWVAERSLGASLRGLVEGLLGRPWCETAAGAAASSSSDGPRLSDGSIPGWLGGAEPAGRVVLQVGQRMAAWQLALQHPDDTAGDSRHAGAADSCAEHEGGAALRPSTRGVGPALQLLPEPVQLQQPARILGIRPVAMVAGSPPQELVVALEVPHEMVYPGALRGGVVGGQLPTLPPTMLHVRCRGETVMSFNASQLERVGDEDAAVMDGQGEVCTDSGVRLRLPLPALPSPGLAVVESGRGEVLGPWLPLLVVPSRGVADELEALAGRVGQESLVPFLVDLGRMLACCKEDKAARGGASRTEHVEGLGASVAADRLAATEGTNESTVTRLLVACESWDLPSCSALLGGLLRGGRRT